MGRGGDVIHEGIRDRRAEQYLRGDQDMNQDADEAASHARKICRPVTGRKSFEQVRDAGPQLLQPWGFA